MRNPFVFDFRPMLENSDVILCRARSKWQIVFNPRQPLTVRQSGFDATEQLANADGIFEGCPRGVFNFAMQCFDFSQRLIGAWTRRDFT
jgi:hypothetical protein